MRRLTLGILAAATLSLGVWAGGPAVAAGNSPCNPSVGSCPPPPPNCVGNTCDVGVTNPPGTGSITPPSNGSGGGGTSQCNLNGQAIPCYDPNYGWFSSSVNCYYQPLNPSPPPSDPAWAGNYPNGAVYDVNCPSGVGDLTQPGLVWLPTPPPGMPTVTPAQLAQQALASLTLPAPVMRRSPTEANSDHGTPYTWVNLWTWFWTDSASWKVQTARAAAGPVWAEVTVAPTRLIISPGQTGTVDVTCAGPGRPWTEADGNSAPAAGGCGFQYRHVSANPITATVTIEWSVAWRGSGGTGGMLPAMRTQVASRFAVQQIQVVTR